MALDPTSTHTRLEWRKAVMAAARAQWEVNQEKGARQPTNSQRPAPVRQSSNAGGLVRFGRDRGKALEHVDLRGLQWYADCLEQNIEDPAKARWRDENASHLADVQRELESRLR